MKRHRNAGNTWNQTNAIRITSAETLFKYLENNDLLKYAKTPNEIPNIAAWLRAKKDALWIALANRVVKEIISAANNIGPDPDPAATNRYADRLQKSLNDYKNAGAAQNQTNAYGPSYADIKASRAFNEETGRLREERMPSGAKGKQRSTSQELTGYNIVPVSQSSSITPKPFLSTLQMNAQKQVPVRQPSTPALRTTNSRQSLGTFYSQGQGNFTLRNSLTAPTRPTNARPMKSRPDQTYGVKQTGVRTPSVGNVSPPVVQQASGFKAPARKPSSSFLPPAQEKVRQKPDPRTFIPPGVKQRQHRK